MTSSKSSKTSGAGYSSNTRMVVSNPGWRGGRRWPAGGRRTEAVDMTGVYRGARAGGEGEDEVLGGGGSVVGGASGGAVAVPMAGRLAAGTRRAVGPWRERKKKEAN
jgi:hypothetical protein